MNFGSPDDQLVESSEDTKLDFLAYTSKSITLFKVKHIQKIFKPSQTATVTVPTNRTLIPLPEAPVILSSTAPYTSFRISKQPLLEKNMLPTRRASDEHQITYPKKYHKGFSPQTQPTATGQTAQTETLQLRSDEVVMFKALESIDKRTQEFLDNPEAVPLSLDPSIECKFSEKQQNIR